MNDQLIEAVVLLGSIRVFVPPAQRDELDHFTISLASTMTEAERDKATERAKERREARDAFQENHDNQLLFSRAPDLPSDPKLVWRLGLLRGKKVAIESWLEGEEYPEEMLIAVQEEDAQLRKEIYGD